MLNPEEAAVFLGLCSHDIPILVAHGLLKPLGNPVQSSVKYFATVVLEELEKMSNGFTAPAQRYKTIGA
jgi:hypothetical protein